jgi:4-amino-4-deoxy-L-arabinose transferase
VAAILALFAAMYVIPLGTRPLTTPDETRYSEIPREMLASGDWTVPRLCTVRYFEKPPLGYWLTAVSIAAFGENRFAVRLPSALATGLSALLVALLVRSATGSAAAARWSAFIFLTMPFVFALGVANILDAPFAAFVTAAVVFAFLGLEETRPAPRTAWLAAAGAAAGAAFLTKGFLGFVIPALVLGPFLAVQRRWRELATAPWVPLAVAIAVVLPWAIAIHASEPDYWRYFVMEEHFQRFLDPRKGQHPEPLWFLVPFLVGGPLMWTFVAPALAKRLPGVWAGQKRLILFCLSWLVLPFLFFSLSSGKLPTYILPCFAPMAALMGVAASRPPAPGSGLARRIGFAVSAAGAAAALAFLAAGPLLQARLRIYGPEEAPAAAVMLVALAAWLGISLLAAWTTDDTRALACAGLAPVPLLVALHFAVPARSIAGRAPERVLAEASSLVTPRTVFFADGYMAPAICWHYKTGRVFLTGEGELAYGLSYGEDKHHSVPMEEVAPRLLDPTRSVDAAVVFPSKRIAWLEPMLPKPDEVREANGVSFYFYRAPAGRGD